MIRTAILGLVLLTAALLQTTLFQYLTIGGFRPDLLLLVTALVALRDGPLPGIRVGFAAGLLADLLLNQAPVGLSALVLLAVGYAVGIGRPYLAPESVFAPLVVAFSATVAGIASYGVLARLLGDPRFTTVLIVETAVVVALFNTLLAPAVSAGLRRLTRSLPLEAAARW